MSFLSTKQLFYKLVMTMTLVTMSLLLVACGSDSDSSSEENKTANTTWGKMTYGTDCWKEACQ